MAVFYYPFDFAFFAHVTPGRCPTEKVPEIFIPLPVAEVVMDLGVAGLTETHEVVPCVSAAFGNGQDVVNFLHRSQPTFLEAHLTEGMLRRIAVTDAFPRSAILAVDIGAALVFVVPAAFLHTVLFTKLSFTEVGAAGMRAGSEWSFWHLLTSFRPCKFHIVRFRASTKSSLIPLRVLLPQSQ